MAIVLFEKGKGEAISVATIKGEFGNRFRAAVEMIWNGWIGQVKTIRIGVGGPSRPCDLPEQEVPEGTDWDAWLGPAPERPYHSDLCPKGVHSHFPAWRVYQEYAGGQVADMGAHHFDIAQWALKMDGSGPVEIIPPERPKADRTRATQPRNAHRTPSLRTIWILRRSIFEAERKSRYAAMCSAT